MFIALSHTACSSKVRCRSVLCHCPSGPHAHGGVLSLSWPSVQQGMMDQVAFAQKRQITLSTFHWQKQFMWPLEFGSVVLYSLLLERAPKMTTRNWHSWQTEIRCRWLKNEKESWYLYSSPGTLYAFSFSCHSVLATTYEICIILFCYSWGSWVQADSVTYLKSELTCIQASVCICVQLSQRLCSPQDSIVTPTFTCGQSKAQNPIVQVIFLNNVTQYEHSY